MEDSEVRLVVYCLSKFCLEPQRRNIADARSTGAIKQAISDLTRPCTCRICSDTVLHTKGIQGCLWEVVEIRLH